MKLNALYLESDSNFRKIHRDLLNDPSMDADALRARHRAGMSSYFEIPRELRRDPSRILKIHKQHFHGMRWPEFEDLILDYEKTMSFSLGRVGDMTFPTLLAARYAMQLDEPWPDFIPLAEDMLKFLYDPNHTPNSSYSTPYRAHRIARLPILIAKYCIKYQLTPDWLGFLYDKLNEKMESHWNTYITNPETGENLSLRAARQDQEEGRIGSEWQNWPVYRDYNGQSVVGDDILYGQHKNVANEKEEIELSRILPQLKKLLGRK